MRKFIGYEGSRIISVVESNHDGLDIDSYIEITDDVLFENIKNNMR